MENTKIKLIKFSYYRDNIYREQIPTCLHHNFRKTIKFKYLIKIISFCQLINGDWGLGIGDWGLGPIPIPQSPIPNPQSPCH